MQRSFGWIEITTFGRSEQDQDSVFNVEFMIINGSSRDMDYQPVDEIRLIVDGVPRAPRETVPSGYVTVNTESAIDGKAIFRVRGRPRDVYVQFGTGSPGVVSCTGPSSNTIESMSKIL